jgi:hypothetical protein
VAADCFAWSTDAFLAALPGLPVFLGGRHADDGLAAAACRAGARVVHRAVEGHRQDGGRGVPALTARINAAIAAAAPAGARGAAGDGRDLTGDPRHA